MLDAWVTHKQVQELLHKIHINGILELKTLKFGANLKSSFANDKRIIQLAMNLSV